MAEEEGKKEEKRWLPVHEVAIRLLKENPLKYLVTLAKIYIAGAKVPPEGIPQLIEAFEEAYEEVKRATITIPSFILPKAEKVVEFLQEQVKGAKGKEE